MNGHTLAQAMISGMGLCTMTLSLSRRHGLRKYAPWLGIAVQPFWFWETWQRGQWGIFLLFVCYLGIYVRAAIRNYREFHTEGCPCR